MTVGQKILTISITFFVITLVLIFLLIYPLFEEIKKNSTELLEAKKGEILLANKIKNLEQFKEIYQTLEPDFEKMDTLFIDQEVPIDFIKFLEETAKESEVLIDISPFLPKTIETDLWPSLGFQISLTGSFPNCSRFIEKIEIAPYLIETQNLNLRRLTAKELKSEELEAFSEGDATANLSIKVFAK